MQETQEKCVRSLSWQPTPVFLPGKQKHLVGYSPWGHKQSDMTEHARMHGFINTDGYRWHSGYKPFIRYKVNRYFLLVCGLAFQFLKCDNFNFAKSNLLVCYFKGCAFVLYNYSLLKPRSFRHSPFFFFSLCFSVSSFIFQSTIHFKLTFVCGVSLFCLWMFTCPRNFC